MNFKIFKNIIILLFVLFLALTKPALGNSNIIADIDKIDNLKIFYIPPKYIFFGITTKDSIEERSTDKILTTDKKQIKRIVSLLNKVSIDNRTIHDLDSSIWLKIIIKYSLFNKDELFVDQLGGLYYEELGGTFSPSIFNQLVAEIENLIKPEKNNSDEKSAD